jgi:hypothetical protein
MTETLKRQFNEKILKHASYYCINSLEVKHCQVNVVHILLDDHDNDWHIFDMKTNFARQFDQHSFRQ